MKSVSPLDEIRVLIANRVREGFDDRETIIEDMVDWAASEFPDHDLEAFIEAMITEQFAEHERTQASWSYPTDCDRLDMAFAELEKRGILARQNFACCQNCGFAEIGEEIRAAAFPVKGFTFYHMQDTEAAMEDGSLCLAYSAIDFQDASCVEIGKQIVEILEKFDLKTAWDGTIQTRIEITGFDWKRRRV
ncbi:MAG: hypothetical protein SF029_12730 [bacterium]|nr:hypothetical protein [bacterium]